MKQVHNRLLGIAVALGFSLSAFASVAAESTLRFVPGGDLEVIDPIWTTSAYTMAHGYMIYDTLFSADENGVTQPQMVGSHKISDDKLTYTFTLRDGLNWHDGKPVTAEDCIVSIKRWAARDGAGQILFKRIRELRVVDDTTFEIELKEPFGVLIDLLGKSASRVPFMMPKRVANTDPDTQITETIGSGPFIFVKDEWVPGSKVVYRKNPNYVPRSEPASGRAGGKVVKVDRVEWNIISDKQTALSAIIAGEVDIWEGTSVDLLPVIEADSGLNLAVTNRTGWYGYLIPNHRLPPFDSPKARKGLAWLMDQTTYMQAVAGNPKFYSTCPSLFACGTPMSTKVGSEAIAGQDTEKARKLFEESGWDFSKPIVLLDPTDDSSIHAATLVTAQALRSIGLTVDVQAMDWATLSKRRAINEPTSKGGWNIFITYGSGITKADPFFSSVYSASCAKGWYTGACDEELERLRAAWPVSETLAGKQEIARQYQKRGYEIGSPWFPFGQWSQPVAHRKNLVGILPAGSLIVFWNIEKR